MSFEFVHKWESQVKKGILTFIMLSLLKGNEFYGYELIEQVKKQTNIAITEGTIYPLMNRLKKENLVISKWVEQEYGIPRKYYRLTDLGIVTLKEMMIYWQHLENAINRLDKN